MPSHRMRGYGSWSIGWREGERAGPPPSGNPWGCGVVAVLFIILLLFTCLKVALETGNGMALLIGLAVVAGIVQGLNK